jgi:hypothetical protein
MDTVSRDETIKRLGTLITGAAIALLLVSSIWIAVHPVAVASAVLDDCSFVVRIRHGDAPGRDEAAGSDLNGCSTQRNLSDKGRNEARDLGAMFRARGINVIKVLTSST